MKVDRSKTQNYTAIIIMNSSCLKTILSKDHPFHPLAFQFSQKGTYGTFIFLGLKFLVNLKTFHRWSYRCDCHVGYHTPRSDQSYLDIDDMRYNEFDVGNAINCVG